LQGDSAETVEPFEPLIAHLADKGKWEVAMAWARRQPATPPLRSYVKGVRKDRQAQVPTTQ